jgi:glycerol-3-phosphate acyltransferase PlsY
MQTFLVVAAAYLLGAVPFGLIIARLYGVKDIRAEGSGNIGATNVWRIAGPKAAIWVYILDIGKGVLAVLLAQISTQTLMPRDLFLIICALAAILGHIFPVYLGFKGGKGVNTGLGVMLMLLPVETLICLVLFIVVVAISKYISLGSIIASVCLPSIVLVERLVLHHDIDSLYFILTALIMAIVVYTHRKNIQRIAAGTENRFSLSSKTNKEGSNA